MSDNLLPFAAKPKPAPPEPIGDPLDRVLAVQDVLITAIQRLESAVTADRVLIVQQAAAIDALNVRAALLEQAVISAGAIAATALARCPEPVIQ